MKKENSVFQVLKHLLIVQTNLYADNDDDNHLLYLQVNYFSFVQLNINIFYRVFILTGLVSMLLFCLFKELKETF